MDGLEAEKSVLGCVLMSPEETTRVYARLSAKMFSAQPLAALYNCCKKLHNSGTPPDVVTVLSKLGDDYKTLIASCAETVPSPDRFDYYVDAVMYAWRVREMTEAAVEISMCGAGCEEMLQKFSNVVARQNYIQSHLEDATSKDFAGSAVEFLEDLFRPDTSIKTGWQDFDRIVGGLQRKSVYVISARPGKGKSDLALQLATKVSMTHKVVYFSMEMSRVQLMQRIASRATRINSTLVRDKKLSDCQQGRVARAMDLMAANCKIDLDEASGINADAVEAKILRESPDVVFIDHLGLMNHGTKKNQWEAVADTTHRLKALAMQHNVAIVELVQLNRRADHDKATQGDLYGGAAVEQDADAIFTLAVEEHEDFMDGDASVEMIATVHKNRHGGTGQLHFAWQPQYHSYTPMEANR